MNNSLRKRNLDTLAIEGDFDPLAKFACHVPLFDRLCIAENLYHDGRIAEIVDAKELWRRKKINANKLQGKIKVKGME